MKGKTQEAEAPWIITSTVFSSYCEKKINPYTEIGSIMSFLHQQRERQRQRQRETETERESLKSFTDTEPHIYAKISLFIPM